MEANILLSIFAALLLLTWIRMLMTRERSERLLTQLGRLSHAPLGTSISIIIPARNEERRITRCLSSLLPQRGAKPEVIVVDDGSTDSTPEKVLGAFVEKGVIYLRLSEDERGWNGKSWACWRGYTNSSGEWLLFIDADVVMLDEYVVADSVRYAIDHGYSALSLIPLLECETYASKVMLPTLNNLLYILAPPHRSNDPSDPLAFFFGAYILIRRETYEELGGHAAVRDKMLEDKAIGEMVKSSGRRVCLLDARRRLRAVFNESLSGYYNGLLRLFTEYHREYGARSIYKYLAAGITVLLLPLVILSFSLLISPLSLPAILSYAVLTCMAGMQAAELRRLGASMLYAPLAPISYAVVIAALIHTAVRYPRRGVTVRWRDREYRLGGPTA